MVLQISSVLVWHRWSTLCVCEEGRVLVEVDACLDRLREVRERLHRMGDDAASLGRADGE